MRPAMFVNPNPPLVTELLGACTLRVLAQPDRADCFILERPPMSQGRGIDAYAILSQGPNLTAAQIAALQEMVYEPLSHYDGHPIYRRLPSVPGFAFRLSRRSDPRLVGRSP